MVKFINIIYFIIAIFIIAFGVAVLVNGSGKLKGHKTKCVERY